MNSQAMIDGWKDSEGRIAGCLPRESKPGEVCPLYSEKIKTIPIREWGDVLSDPNRVLLRPSVPVILSQGSIGSCSAESATQTIMTCRSFHGQPFTLLNPWHLYHFSSGGRDGGSNIDTNLRYLRDQGVAPESVWPRSKGFRARPSAESMEAAKAYRILEFFDIQTVEEFGSALMLGYTVSYGRRGHSIMGVEVIDEKSFRFVNSWGDWGDGGFGVERFSGINWGYGAWAVRVVTDTGGLPVVRSAQSPGFEPWPITAI